MKNSVGKRAQRVDGLAKVTGCAKFVADLMPGGALCAKILHSPHPHAEIVSIDTTAAEKLPGVKAVICGRDYPLHTGLYHVDQYMFAMEKVRYVGEPVAAVAALDEKTAAQAIDLIKVRYRKLKPNFDPIHGMKKSAPLIHPNLHKYFHVSAINPVPHTNIANHFKIRKGDPDSAFKKSFCIIENRFHVPQIQHVPMETHGAIALAEQTGRITVWSSCQSPFTVRYLMANCFKREIGDIRVIAPYVGGGFGCKAGINIEPITVALALKCPGRHVKLILTREEEMYTVVVRQACHIRIKSGVDRTGRILAQENEYIWDCGAYAGYGVNIVRAAGYSICGAYNIDNLKGDSIGVYTNRPVGSAFRGFGMSEIHWAIEQQMDILAHELGIDPVEFRHINALKPGSHNATGELVTVNTGNIHKCLDQVAADLGWGKKLPKYRALGIALAQKAPAMPNNATSSAVVKFNENGGVELLFSGMEIGQGVMTAMAQICAETLEIPLEKVTVVGLPDTDYSPYEWQTVASRLTFSCGNAVKKAAEDAICQMKIISAGIFKVRADDVVYKNGVFSHKNKSIELVQICMGYQFTDGHTVGGAIVGRGHFTAEGCINCDPDTGYSPKPVANWTFGAQGVDLSVCPETGRITIHKVSCTYDVGKVINPLTIEGQAYGGIVQGMGAGIMEQLIVDEQTGMVKNPSLVDYKIPTALDMPEEMTASFVETAQLDGPFGARGVGEHTMIPTPAAIANAVYHATGVRIMDLPVTPEKILSGMHGLDFDSKDSNAKPEQPVSRSKKKRGRPPLYAKKWDRVKR
ncbi:MAG: xanthine dehydrogenase family protein molybdopterin-binding subunit [Candidatus Wallbacteria bacterium]|nr:xanthine dehydrogenase family protein molybdopterin-binding subunit [Candidatus Wallbacteria bacterium]